MDEEKKNKKRKKRLSFFQQAKKQGKRGRFGQGEQIDEDTYQYFIRIMEINRDDFSTKEEKDIFVNNVFAQIEGQEKKCACNQLTSRVVEDLLPSASDEVLKRLMSVFFEDIRPLCSHPFASHVLQTLLVTVSERGLASSDNQAKENVVSEFSVWVLQVSRYMLNNLEEFVWDIYANHVIRTCLECLSGVPAQRGKGMKRELVQENKEVPLECKELVKEFGSRLQAWPQLHELPYKKHTTGLLQTLLHALRAVDKKATRKFVKKLLCECFAKEEDTGENELHRFFYCEEAIRLVEVALAVASKKLFTQFYAFCFSGKLVALSKHPFANFAVQRLFTHCKQIKEFEAMFDEIANEFESILESGNTGVLVSVAQACCRLATRQNQFIKHLMQALHCLEPDSRRESLGYLVARLANYEKWNSNKETFTVAHNGSVLLQTMLKFSKPIRIVNCLMAMNLNDLKALLCDPKGSYVMDAFMTAEFVGEKSRDRMIRKLQGTYVELARSKHGSRCVDAIWAVARLKQKVLIMEELASREAILNNDQFGRILVAKYGASLYNHSKEDWKEVQGKEEKAKALFADIIGDTGKKKSVSALSVGKRK